MTTLAAPRPLTSLGRPLDLRPEAFGFFEPSNDLLDDPEALRHRLATEGYLFFRKFLDADLILEARRSILVRLAAEGWLDPKSDMEDGVVHPDHLENFTPVINPRFENALTLRTMKAGAFRPDLAVSNAAVERVVYGPELQGFYDAYFGEPALHFDYTWLRVMGPGRGTPSHCDWVYMGRGSQDLLTCWIPYGRVPLEVGGLMVLERSHLQAHRIRNYLDKDVDAYCEKRPKEVRKVRDEGGWAVPGWLSTHPESLPAKFGQRWLTCECWEPGDFITFNMRLIHGSLDNRGDRFRISTDVRYQPSSHPADERWIGANPPGHSRAGKRGRIC